MRWNLAAVLHRVVWVRLTRWLEEGTLDRLEDVVCLTFADYVIALDANAGLGVAHVVQFGLETAAERGGI